MMHSEISEIGEISLVPMDYERTRLRTRGEISPVIQRSSTLFRSQFRCVCQLSLPVKSAAYNRFSLNSLISLTQNGTVHERPPFTAEPNNSDAAGRGRRPAQRP